MFTIQRNPQLRAKWWDDPELPRIGKRITRRQAERLSAEDEIVKVPTHKHVRGYAPGKFKASRYWLPYSKIGVDHGYVCPLYSLKEIGRRYGLSQASRRYWRQHILPEPLTVVMRRGVRSHHWSKIQLIALDEVLLYLESKGHLQFNLKYADAIDLFHYGCDVLARYYKQRDDEHIPLGYDRFGVRGV